ncbi:MAG: hypothetical protein QMB61_06075 [Clostridiaceae bacterium]
MLLTQTEAILVLLAAAGSILHLLIRMKRRRRLADLALLATLVLSSALLLVEILVLHLPLLDVLLAIATGSLIGLHLLQSLFPGQNPLP